MAANATGCESELHLFGRFSRAFSHVMRGDLSVIANEVSYLATKMPSEDLSRVRGRCSQMAATISKIAGLQSEPSRAIVSANAVARTFGAVLQGREEDAVALDSVKIERLACGIRQLFPSSDVAWTARPHDQDSLALELYIPTHQGLGARYASWSSFVSKELGERVVIDAVVADLIMRAHGWTVGIESSKRGLRCEMRIPLASAEQRQAKCA